MEYRSLSDMGKTITLNTHKIPPSVDLVVGIPGSGMLAGSLIALSLNTLAADLQGFIENRTLRHGFTRNTKTFYSSPREARHVLLVNDAIVSGHTMQKAREKISAAGIEQIITACVVYAGHEHTENADLIFEQLRPPFAFEWSLMYSPLLQDCCVDIDGLFLDIPLTNDVEDRQARMRSIRDARPLTVPSQPAGVLVTDYPETFRHEIETWLDKHNIRYRKLHMPEHGGVNGIRRSGHLATFKSRVYQDYPEAPLFIESSSDLARTIALQTGRKVLSYMDQEIFTPEYLRAMATKQIRSLPSRILRKMSQLALRDPLAAPHQLAGAEQINSKKQSHGASLPDLKVNDNHNK